MLERCFKITYVRELVVDVLYPRGSPKRVDSTVGSTFFQRVHKLYNFLYIAIRARISNFVLLLLNFEKKCFLFDTICI